MPCHVPRIIALAPRGTEGVAVAVAAVRAGALGMLDLEGIESDASLDALRRAAGLAEGLGVRVEAGVASESWLASLPGSIGVVCGLADEGDWTQALGRIARSGRVALAEVTTREQAVEAAEAGASGVILAGHEAGGRCAEESSFILLQAVVADGLVPAWVRGGVGPLSASGCVAAGAAGVVLDGALLLARESPLGESARAIIARLDGGETVVIRPSGRAVRVYAPPGSGVLARLKGLAPLDGQAEPSTPHPTLPRKGGGEDLGPGTRKQSAGPAGDTPRGTAEIGWGREQAWPIGQDAAFASGLAKKYVTTGGIVRAVESAIDRGIALARSCRPLAPGSALAEAHGTRYPIVQGPMTRVSDTAAFASAVAEGGGLPFLALAMLRGPEVRALLDDASERLAGKPWGVGVLGFVTPELRREQVEAVRDAKPPFALIAGGRPDQARELEDEGIPTYLHAPSPGLLGQYLKDGTRRFVLEGRECGGHVGPRSSLVLWGQAVALLSEFVDRGNPAGELHVLFAGGIHDARSSAAVAAIAAPLAAKGAKVGVLIGTAYLFTQEAVSTGAIVPRFQAEAVRCRRTVLLETGPGHEVRVGPSPFAGSFAEARRRMLAEGKSAEEVRAALEAMNAGRLRVAAKGLDRADGSGSPLVAVAEPEQYERGIYMLGQVATLRERVTTIADLHDDISNGGAALLDAAQVATLPEAPPARPSDVAIVGLSAILPGAADARAFWENTLRGIDAIVEIPPDRWDWRTYYDADPKAPDKVVSKWGGFVPDVPFDPLRYGMPPTSLPSIEPVQLLVLEAVRRALDDAGYTDRPFPRERTAVVLGMGGGAAQLAMGYAFRSYLPMLESVAPEAGRAARAASEPYLPEWTEDSFPGFLLNVAAGRVANRFDLGGSNYTVDAACGSSLAAASLAVRELETGAADMVILGGADTVQNPLTYLAFSKTHAFSPRGRCRPFDASADGIVISEGVGVVVLKRLADAERDGDRIYAVIKGMGSSSDGRARGLTAPNVDGQTRALRRAYEKSGVDPKTLGYVEAHGTGTAVGDVVEVNALAGVLREAGADPRSCAVGSVKSMIGHTKCAAGIAGLINAALALHHKTLPPTIGVEGLNPKADLAGGPLRVSTKARPWFHADRSRPRRAGVSAFGFGGTNFHAVLEGYDRDPVAAKAPRDEWPAELLLWRGETPGEILGSVDRLIDSLGRGARPRLRDLAHSLAERYARGGRGRAEGEPQEGNASAPGSRGSPSARPRPPLHSSSRGEARPTLAIVASTLEDLKAKLATAREALASGKLELTDPRGVHYADRPAFAGEPVAFLFPGQGSQALEMLGELALAFPEVREAFEATDAALLAAGRPAITPLVFPPTTLDDAGRERARHALTATEVAQPAVGAASVGMLRLLASLGVMPGSVAGHSYGELVALHAAGCLTAESLAVLSEARGRLMREAAGSAPGAMAAIAAGADRVAGLLEPADGVVVANLNGPRQTVVSGPVDGVARVVDRARSRGLRAFDLPVACAFHSAAVAGASTPLEKIAQGLIAAFPDRPTFANLDAAPHPADPAAIAARLGAHVASPVRFAEMIAAMHGAGSRVFVEAGPGAVLGPMVASILEGKPHLSVSCDAPGRPAIPALLGALAKLSVAGVAVDPARLMAGRDARRVDLDRLPIGDGSPPLPASTWLVNGSRSRPISGPEPKRLGQAMESRSLVERNGHHSAESNGKHESKPSIPMIEQRPDDRASSSNGFHPHPRFEASGHGRPASVAAAPPAPSEPGSVRVMEAFQQTMRAFLQTQEATMLAYLGRRGGGVPDDRPRGHEASPGSPPTLPSPSRGEGFPMARSNGTAHHPGAPGGLAAGAAMAFDQPKREHTGTGNGVHAGPIPALVGEPPVAPGEGSPAVSLDSTPARASIADRLIAIVRERTGYPAEMLQLGLDLEADLGIDSIKRVEILGTLRDSVDGLDATDSSVMDGLARAKTLGEIVERVEAVLGKRTLSGSSNGQGNPPPPAGEGRLGGVTSDEAMTTALPPTVEKDDFGGAAPQVRRLVLESIEAPLSDHRTGLMPGGLVVVTDDGRGVARALAGALREEGHPVEVVGPDRVDLSSPTAVEAMLAEARESGPIAGIVHALPLRDLGPPGLDPAAWSGRVGTEVKGLFLLARAASADLDAASGRGGACLVAATAMGGAFAASGTSPGDFFPGQGGVAGLVKTLAREWPEVRARVVDLDPSEPADALAARLADEALADDGWPEVGYRRGRRVRLRVAPSPVRAHSDELRISPGEPVLVTGGARGITAAVAAELARTWRPTLLLVGSSPMPPEAEDPATAGLVHTAELKAALHGRLRRAGRAVGPADLERAYRTLLHERQIRDGLRALREAGSAVEYARADVRDAEALARALGAWRGRFGDPVGLIHGAGVIHDKLLRDKTPESFDRVLGTKLDGALNLARLVRPEALRFAAFFSSIAGRFGNKGQSDYAAANEVLNKLAVWLDRRWPGRVLSVGWGPWSGVGMVSDLEGHLGRRGLGMIPPALGCAAMVDELRFGRKGDVEVVVAGELGRLDEPLRPARRPAGVSP